MVNFIACWLIKNVKNEESYERGLIILMMGAFESEVNRNLKLFICYEIHNHSMSSKWVWNSRKKEKKVINNQYFQFILSSISISPSRRRSIVFLSISSNHNSAKKSSLDGCWGGIRTRWRRNLLLIIISRAHNQFGDFFILLFTIFLLLMSMTQLFVNPTSEQVRTGYFAGSS